MINTKDIRDHLAKPIMFPKEYEALSPYMIQSAQSFTMLINALEHLQKELNETNQKLSRLKIELVQKIEKEKSNE